MTPARGRRRRHRPRTELPSKSRPSTCPRRPSSGRRGSGSRSRDAAYARRRSRARCGGEPHDSVRTVEIVTAGGIGGRISMTGSPRGCVQRPARCQVPAARQNAWVTARRHGKRPSSERRSVTRCWLPEPSTLPPLRPSPSSRRNRRRHAGWRSAGGDDLVRRCRTPGRAQTHRRGYGAGWGGLLSAVDRAHLIARPPQRCARAPHPGCPYARC